MKTSIIHPICGEITCEENIWTGKIRIQIGNDVLIKSRKNTYLWDKGKDTEVVMLKGSFVTGLFLTIRQEQITVVPTPATLDYFLSCLPLALIILLGHIPALYRIIPIGPGALGLGLGSAALIIALARMRGKSIGNKLLITFICTVAPFVIYYMFLLVMVLLYFIGMQK